jgi:hypothetical protein
VAPNLTLLQNALDQTGGDQLRPAQAWRELLRTRLSALDMDLIGKDVAPFLERAQDVALLTRANLIQLL